MADRTTNTRPRTLWWRFKLFATGLLLVLACMVVYALAIEPGRLVVRKQTVQVEPWPSALNGLRVALVSDIHAGSWAVGDEKLRELTQRINELHPDLVLVLGDNTVDPMFHLSYKPITSVARALGAVRAPLGVFAVLGNHDWSDGGLRAWRAFEAAGIAVLENEARPLEWRGTRFWLAGIADEWTSKPDVQGTLAPVPRGAPVLAMTHNPNAFVEIPPRVTLTVAGHTHGGQVDWPIVGPIVIPTNGRAYRRGFYADHGRRFFVTSGVGTGQVPGRLRVPPEIAILTLRAGPPG